MPNRLAQETSPYLLQHQNNPVDWYAWGDEAFAEAKRLDKPILLSVGYSACHWCHVMAHESFEDTAIAAQMNDAYINIKVDREERPDVDAIYMGAVQAMTGRGGWPMTVFLTPAGVPFYGGTYFPPEDRQGMPGLTRVLAAVADAYKNKRGEVEQAGQQLLGALSTTADLQPTDGALTVEVLDTAAAALISVHDDDFGGFGRAPKFPQAMVLEFLLRQHKRTGDHEPLRVAEISLQRMAGGGMYDQVGGGFHRYSTDSVWLVPHFEKMLYDNALLARLYLDAYKLTGNQDYQRITRETLDYVLREMTNLSGGFYSAQDADSEGEEGRFFLWTPAQLREVLPDDADVIGRYFGVSEAGNFEGRNILHADKPADEWARDEGIDPAKFASLLRYAKAQLYKARELRVHPGRDEKVLTAWNGMMLRAFAEAAYVLKDATYLRVAQNNANFLIREMRDTNGRLLRTWKDGRAHLMAYLEDYACMADGLLALYQATFDPHYFVEARRLADEMIHLFWDESLQGFFDTGSDHEALITRPRDLWDNATPSGSSVAADVLLRLALLTDTPLYEHCAVTSLSSIAPVIERAATGFGRALSVIDFHLSSSQELAVVWPDGSGAEAAGPMLDVVRGRYAPNLMLVGSPAGQVENVSMLLDDRQALRDRTTAYLCERYVCQAPTTDPEELREQVDAARI